jgi:hypothetical protein
MPDEPGEVRLRTTAIRSQYPGEAESNLAIHIETGLMRRLGLRVPADNQDYDTRALSTFEIVP